MNLAFMDASFGIIKYIKYINLQWTRRYYEPGEFSVQLPASEYVSDAVYLYTKDRPEVGIIQKREYADGYDGEVMQLSGFFYEYKLNDKITFPRFERSGNIEDLARAIVSTYKADIPLLQLGDANSPRLGTSTTKQSTGKGLATPFLALHHLAIEVSACALPALAQFALHPVGVGQLIRNGVAHQAIEFVECHGFHIVRKVTKQLTIDN